MDLGSRYFLYGYFGTGNFGDEILLYAAIKNILSRDPGAHFLLRNYGPVDLEKEFPGRVTCTNLEKVHTLSYPGIIKFFILIQTYWRYIGQASYLVIGGGTLIHDTPNLKSTFLLLCLCCIAKIRGRSIFGIGLGTQTLKTRRGKIIIRLLTAMFDKLCLRDKPSYDQIQLLSGDRKHIKQTTDLAYTLPIEETTRHTKNKVIAVTLADYLLERLEAPVYEASMKTLAKTLESFIKQGYKIRLIALQKDNQVFGITGDAVVNEDLISKITSRYRDQIESVTVEATPESITKIFDGVSLVLGMRFHSLIFSALKQIPFVGLSEEPKIRAICDEFSMPCFATDVWDNEFISQAAEKNINNAINPELIEEYRQLAQDNFEFVCK